MESIMITKNKKSFSKKLIYTSAILIKLGTSSLAIGSDLFSDDLVSKRTASIRLHNTMARKYGFNNYMIKEKREKPKFSLLARAKENHSATTDLKKRMEQENEEIDKPAQAIITLTSEKADVSINKVKNPKMKKALVSLKNYIVGKARKFFS